MTTPKDSMEVCPRHIKECMKNGICMVCGWHEDWEERYKKLIIHRSVDISAHGILTIRDFIRSELSLALKEERKRIAQVVRDEKYDIFGGKMDGIAELFNSKLEAVASYLESSLEDKEKKI